MYVTVQITGLADVNRTKITISPNPAKDFILIKGLPKTGSLQITDIAGRTVMEVNAAEDRIDISQLATGVYFVMVTGESFYERVKLVKE